MMSPDAPGRRADHEAFRLYTPEEAAEILRCKASWLKEQARLRRIPFTLVAGAYRFTIDHLAQIVESNEHRPVLGLSEPPAPPRNAAEESDPAAPPLRARPPRRRPRPN